MSVEYSREAPFSAIVCFWLATLVTSWVLMGFAVAGIWWLVT